MPHRNLVAPVDLASPRDNPSKMLQQPNELMVSQKVTCETPLPDDTTVEIIHSGKWLSFGHINYTDPVHKTRRQWEFVRRNRHTSSTVDAVDILATLTKKDMPDSIILVAQYRPAIQQICVEFPAGLIDPEESVFSAAKRELLEETGYHSSETIYTSSGLFYDAGLSDSNMQLVHIQVDGDSPQNQNPKSQLELDEWSMETLVFPLNDLLNSLTGMHFIFQNSC
ncbi:ADP-ribose diphosphatase, variant 2 [Entomophthora muscae]|uniref:ADP-ribose diphosphatase, variant 2 n=1 Tax=Entomophthora muscae TaxID=34485 RepID=A0ACC2S9E7_9FUNG|nr:ADP-ribose diphosphatase, variant 2 [Entomophthora muscae]